MYTAAVCNTSQCDGFLYWSDVLWTFDQPMQARKHPLHSPFLHSPDQTFNVITGLLSLVFMQWILVTMANRRLTQSAPSYVSEREADGTRVVHFINFHSRCRSTSVQRHEHEWVFVAESDLIKLERQFRIMDRDGKMYNRQAREQIHKQQWRNTFSKPPACKDFVAPFDWLFDVTSGRK